jgi:hypothetical protein
VASCLRLQRLADEGCDDADPGSGDGEAEHNTKPPVGTDLGGCPAIIVRHGPAAPAGDGHDSDFAADDGDEK